MAEINVVAIGARFLVGIASTGISHSLRAWLFRISAEKMGEIGVVAIGASFLVGIDFAQCHFEEEEIVRQGDASFRS